MALIVNATNGNMSITSAYVIVLRAVVEKVYGRIPDPSFVPDPNNPDAPVPTVIGMSNLAHAEVRLYLSKDARQSSLINHKGADGFTFTHVDGQDPVLEAYAQLQTMKTLADWTITSAINA